MLASSISRASMGGRIEGRRWASMDLPAPGRPDHQEMMAAGRRDFERPLGRFLALDVLEIEACGRVLGDRRLGPRQDLACPSHD